MRLNNTPEARQALYDAVRRIALHGVVNPKTNTVYNTGTITGYVAKIHVDDDLAGTIDVQEFLDLSDDPEEDVDIGYHEGVMISAIQNSGSGMVIVPKLYSEVTIATDPVTLKEYVVMFSHVDIIQLDAHEKVVVGVTEREEFDIDNDDAPDIEDLKATGVFSKTTYLRNSIVSEVKGEDSGDHTKIIQNDENVEINIGDSESVIRANQNEIDMYSGNSGLHLDDDEAVIENRSSVVSMSNGITYVGSKSNTSSGVLYEELANILQNLLNYIAQMKTTTQLGPQPPLNVASFLALKSQIANFRSLHVKIQK